MFLNKSELKSGKSFKKIIIFSFIFISLAIIFSNSVGHVSAASNTIYVSSSGSDSNSGQSWSTAKKTIKSATNTVSSGGTIYIAAGTYSGTGNTGLTITKSISIKGASQSNTIIDAKNLKNIFTISSGKVVTLKNMKLINGKSYNGGAIYNQGKLTIYSCTFSKNTATSSDYGGGAIMNHGTLTVTGGTFTGNTAKFGGAININVASGVTTVINCKFTSNTATGRTFIYNGIKYNLSSAGAIWNCGTLSVSGSTFTSNTATAFGGAIYTIEHTTTITKSNFTSNRANTSGGAIYNSGTLKVTYSNFSKNTAAKKGAIYNSGKLTSVSNTFSGNSS